MCIIESSIRVTGQANGQLIFEDNMLLSSLIKMELTVVELVGLELLGILIFGLIAILFLVGIGSMIASGLVRFFRTTIPKEETVGVLTKFMDMVEPVKIVLVIGFILTILFGIAAFYVTFNDQSSSEDKGRAMLILKWLLGGWGFGSGSSLVMILLRSKKGK